MLTETYYCPLTGDNPGPHDRYHAMPPYYGPNTVLIPGRELPAGTSDIQADHERAMLRAHSWRRLPTGEVIVWVEM